MAKKRRNNKKNKKNNKLEKINNIVESKVITDVDDNTFDIFDTDLSLTQIKFCKEFLKTGNATDSYRKTIFLEKDVSENSIRELARRELKKIPVANYLRKIKRLEIVDNLGFNYTYQILGNWIMDKLLDGNLDIKDEIKLIDLLTKINKEDINTETTIKFTTTDSDLSNSFHNLLSNIEINESSELTDDAKLELINAEIENENKLSIVKDLTEDELKSLVDNKKEND